MKKFKQFLSLALLLLLLISQTGCWAAVAVGAGTGIAYWKGSINANVNASLKEAAEATLKTAQELRLTLIDSRSDEFDGSYIFRTVRDEEVSVSLSKLTYNSTDVTIRVNYFGDDKLSQHLLRDIRFHLTQRKKGKI